MPPLPKIEMPSEQGLPAQVVAQFAPSSGIQ
jgi:hypothetical protein